MYNLYNEIELVVQSSFICEEAQMTFAGLKNAAVQLHNWTVTLDQAKKNYVLYDLSYLELL